MTEAANTHIAAGADVLTGSSQSVVGSIGAAKEAGPKKIEVIKTIRQLTSLGLKEAKDMAETAGAKVLEGVSKEVANDAKSKLEAAGAVTEMV